MKKDKSLGLVIGINSLSEIQYPAYTNHIQLFYRLGKEFPDSNICLVNPSRVGIDKMRNMAAQVAIDQNFEYLLFIDDDVIVPMDCLRKLLECNADIAAGDVIIRGYPFDHMCFSYSDPETKRNLHTLREYPKDVDIVNVDAVGFSCCLIKVSLLKKLSPPYFITGINHTEDIYFCIKARTESPNCTIVVNTKVLCGHILWPEVISTGNRKQYKQYFEKMNPGVKQQGEVNLKIKRVNSKVSYADVVKQEIFHAK